MSKKKKTVMAVGVGMVATVLLSAGIYFWSSTEGSTQVKESVEGSGVASHVLSYTQDGVVSLYALKQKKIVEEFDLKTLSKKTADKEINDQQPKMPPASQTIQKQVKPLIQSGETFKDFVKVPISVEKGGNAWEIQSKLTPHRNIAAMLRLVMEVNHRMNLHPIYPGEKIIFLKEHKGEEIVKSKPVEKLESEVDQRSQQAVKKTTIAKNEKSKFLYYGSVEDKTLYAYSNSDKAIYRMKESAGKLQVINISKSEHYVTADGLLVTNKQVLLFEKGTHKLQMIDHNDLNKMETLELEGQPSHYVVYGDSLYYTFGDKLGKLNLVNKEKKSVLLGDDSKGLVVVDYKLYILNAFGTRMTNSVLMKVDPSDLHVDQLLELKTDESAILSKGETDELYVGRITKEKDLRGNVLKKNEITAINVKTLTMGKSTWFIPFGKESAGYDSHLYMLQNGKLNVYAVNDVKPQTTFNIKGEHFTILP
ncbi:hypothetical protein JOD82_001685 [Paenibacillus sp. 1182]|uniref:hypothetical protein n=1 Tax=Paenibacillus sp. 1182 TaxID=2806565 RepID=UPI001AE55903|nr:hypothetical protein [Paenibacillus sp. 1182]MBP1308665.1 hypothetical protein [Paenibacillus sp. 1182]